MKIKLKKDIPGAEAGTEYDVFPGQKINYKRANGLWKTVNGNHKLDVEDKEYLEFINDEVTR